MKNLFLFSFLFPVLLIAQISDYELEFNSATLDYVEMPNASSVIANKTEFTISGWVNPQMDASHSGFFGFRNNSDADFFLLQLQNSTNVEARFRNSAGGHFDVVANSILDIGQWQHLAFTYDGSYIRLYKNGSMVDSAAANGTITNVSQSFKIGSLDYQTSSFPMQGSADEIRLWDVALSQVEINNWMCDPVYLTHPNYNNLMGYWRLNDGQGTIAVDQSANGNNGTLMGGIQWQISTTCFGSTTLPLTYVPDDNFENYLEANGMGDGIPLNDNVLTSNINTVTNLNLDNQNISNLTGIEDFTALYYLAFQDNWLISLDVSQNTALTHLNCNNNQLTSLDVSANINLDSLRCGGNQLASLDVSFNTVLTRLYCDDNQLTSLDVNNNTDLIHLMCYSNQLTSLDVSNNTALNYLVCDDNQLTSLDVRNGNNTNFFGFGAATNPNLSCINVDDSTWSTNNWTYIDPQHYFSTNCNATSIDETKSSERKLIKTINVLGRESKGAKNEPLFFIYEDGIVEKRIVIE